MPFRWAVLLLAALPAFGQPAQIGFDPRIELLSIVFHLAGNPEYNQCKLTSYCQDVDTYFKPFKEHEAIRLARDLNAKSDINYDAVMSMAIHIKDVESLAERVPIDSPGTRLEKRWRAPRITQHCVEVDHGIECAAGANPFIDLVAPRLLLRCGESELAEWGSLESPRRSVRSSFISSPLPSAAACDHRAIPATCACTLDSGNPKTCGRRVLLLGSYVCSMGIRTGATTRALACSHHMRTTQLRSRERQQVDTEAHLELAARFQVRGIHNFVVLRNGKVVLQRAGVSRRRNARRPPNRSRCRTYTGRGRWRFSIAILEAAGYACTRSAASLGAFDIVGVGSADVVLVQVKTRDWPGADETEAMRILPAPANCRVGRGYLGRCILRCLSNSSRNLKHSDLSSAIRSRHCANVGLSVPAILTSSSAATARRLVASMRSAIIAEQISQAMKASYGKQA